MHGRPYRHRSWFTRFAKSTARTAGHPATFSVAVAITLLWAASGPLFGFSDTWQLVINTGTTTRTSNASAPAITSWPARRARICAPPNQIPMLAKSVKRIVKR